jgi:hypothetical protein
VENIEISARVCSCGCGRKLLLKDGSPDYSARRLATADCRKRDKVNRIMADRARRKKKRDLIIVPVWVTFNGKQILLPTPRAAAEAFMQHCTILEAVEIHKAERPKRHKKQV